VIPYHNPRPPVDPLEEPHWALKILAWIILLSAFGACGFIFYKLFAMLIP